MMGGFIEVSRFCLDICDSSFMGHHPSGTDAELVKKCRICPCREVVGLRYSITEVLSGLAIHTCKVQWIQSR
ncbi:hypothetical protein CBOM_07984 [Ceraceosorus bombacis]|uniref:Uncharacterized protein n=1 Tax=Ceraceosorus bombacis TaxID=401625 RepID=A0A0P1BAN4_9BASI|nr:hypothetical protein CBOM_07984 [Ceraceosorus bombacis]